MLHDVGGGQLQTVLAGEASCQFGELPVGAGRIQSLLQGGFPEDERSE